MKAITFLFSLLVILSFSYCKSNNKNDSQLTNQDYTQKKIFNKAYNMDTIRKFDIERYKKNIDPKELEYDFIDSVGNKIRQFEDVELYIEYVQNPKELFYLFREYYKETGILKRTGLCQKNGGFQYGIWKLYDNSGNPVQEIDYEKPYKFSWENVLQFIKKENVDLEDSFTYITRVNNTVEGKYWVIIWDTKKMETEKPLKRVHLDGDNGQITFESYYEIEY